MFVNDCIHFHMLVMLSYVTGHCVCAHMALLFWCALRNRFLCFVSYICLYVLDSMKLSLNKKFYLLLPHSRVHSTKY